MKPIDLNCDLGEGEPEARTAALMRWISSANIACGGHAGNEASMRHAVRLAVRHGVRIGVHPGTTGVFGRGADTICADEFEALLSAQVRRLARVAAAEGQGLHHVKLHGALYHLTEGDEGLARRYVTFMARFWQGVRIYAKADGRVIKLARRRGIEAWGEAFLDRGYDDDGSLISRDDPAAMIGDPDRLRSRLFGIRLDGTIRSRGELSLRFNVRTVCVHSDTPSACALVALARRSLGGRIG
jgi:UPF0271 protein